MTLIHLEMQCLGLFRGFLWPSFIGKGEVRVYRGTGVSHRVRRTTWDRSLKNWELQIPCFEEFFWGGNTLGLIPASLPHALGYACTFYAPTSPPPNLERIFKRHPEIGDQGSIETPKKGLSNPEGSIEPPFRGQKGSL